MQTHATAMMPLPHPHEPLRGSDGGFTRDSIVRRLPDIVAGIMSANPGLPARTVEALRALEADMRADAPLRRIAPDAPVDENAWDPAWYESYLASGATWLSAPWFLVETWAYRQIADVMATTAGGLDPFIPQKKQALQVALPAFLSTVAPLYAAAVNAGSTSLAEALQALLLRALWGNRADLSLSAGHVEVHGDRENDGAFLLANHSISAVKALLGSPPAPASAPPPADADAVSDTLVYAVDNTGLELLCDLALIDACLTVCPGLSRVCLHVKPHPTFVSDVCLPVEGDLRSHIQALQGLKESHPGHPHAATGVTLGASLDAHLAAGRLVVSSHPFYCSPLPWWEAPEELWAQYGAARAVVIKGDAQYRRLLGDAHWPHTTPWGAATAYWSVSAPPSSQRRTLIALRTAKAGVLAGAEADQVAAATARAPSDWMTSGEYGLVLAADF